MMAGSLKKIDVFEEWLIKRILVNRNFALFFCFLVELLLPIVIVEKFSRLATIRARAHAAKLALLVEKNEIQRAKDIFLDSFSLYQKLPKAFFLVFELMLDKNVLIKNLIDASLELKPFLSSEFTVYQNYLTKLVRALLLSDSQKDLNAANRLLVEALDKFDSKNIKDVIPLAFEVKDDQIREEVLRVFETKLKKQGCELYDWFLYYSYQSSEELGKLEETTKRLLELQPLDHDLNQVYCASLFLQDKYDVLAARLNVLPVLLNDSLKKKYKDEKAFKEYVDIGLILYSYGYLSCFQEKVGNPGFSSKSVSNPYLLALVSRGIVEAYNNLRFSSDRILSNFKNINYVKLTHENVADYFKSGVVFLASVNSLCNQFMQSSFYADIERDFNTVKINCDKRLLNTFKRSFPNIGFLPVDKEVATSSLLPNSQKMMLNEEIIDAMKESHLVSAIPFNLYLSSAEKYTLLAKKGGWLKTSPITDEAVKGFLGKREGLNIGLSIGSGRETVVRKKHFLQKDDVVELIQRFDKANFYNLDYHVDIEDFNCSNGSNFRSPNFDLKNDLDHLLSFLGALDLVIVTPNNLMDMCASIGKEAIIVDLTSQMLDWEIDTSGHYLYSEAVKFLRPQSKEFSARAQIREGLTLLIEEQYERCLNPMR